MLTKSVSDPTGTPPKRGHLTVRIAEPSPTVHLTPYFDHPLSLDCQFDDGTSFTLTLDSTETARLMNLLNGDARLTKWAETVAFSDQGGFRKQQGTD